MKKVIYGGLFLALVGVGVIGCKKESFQTAGEKGSDTETSQLKSMAIKTDGRLLIFNTVADFDAAIERSGEDLYRQLHDLGFKSFAETIVSESDDVLEDEFLSNVLNQDLAIQIGNYIYKIDKPNLKVYALPVSEAASYNDLIAENTANKYVLTFSTEDNVFELLGEAPNTDKALSKNCQSTKENNDGGWKKYADYTDVDNDYGNGSDKHYKFEYYCRVRYDNWGIYRKLFTEFKHKETGGGTFNGTYVSFVYKVSYAVKNGNSGNVTHDANYNFSANTTIEVATSYYEYFTDNKEIVHYKGSKCLKAYDLNSWVWMRNRETFKPILAPSSGCIRINDGGMCVYPCSYDPPC